MFKWSSYVINSCKLLKLGAMSVEIEWVIGLVAGSSVLAAIITHYLGNNANERSKRRKLYAEALQVALGWREMLYRVRRRQPTSEDEKTITAQFHNLQERLDYYDGLIWSYSKSLGRSYRRLVKKVRKTSLPLIREAWKNKPIPPQDYESSKLKNPKFDVELRDFMNDVVRQTKPRYRIFAKLKLWWGNRNDT